MNILNRVSNLLKKTIRTIILIKNKIIIIKFQNPKKKNILIIDHYNEHGINECLLEGLDYGVLDTRLDGYIVSQHRASVRIFIGFEILYYLFYYFFIKKTNSLYNSYIFSYIRVVNPNVVIDQTKYGFLLEAAMLLPQINFFILMDALLENISKKEGIFAMKYFSYDLLNFLNKDPSKVHKNIYINLHGLRDKDMLLDIGININQFNLMITGSYKANYVKKKVDVNYKTKFDITYISQTESSYLVGLINRDKYFYEVSNAVHGKILENLAIYIKRKNLSCLIQLRDQFTSEIETDFIKSFFKEGQNITFRKREHYLTSYYSILDSKLSISSHSNLSHEAMILERKSLLSPLEFSSHYRYTPKKFKSAKSMWDWTITKSDYQIFEEKCDLLLNMDKQDYLKNTKEKSNYIINYGINDNNKLVLKEKILSLI